MNAPVPAQRRRPTMVAGAWIAVGLLLAFLVLGVGFNGASLILVGYLGLIIFTAIVVNGLRREPGSWLGRRVVRRVLVAAVLCTCGALVVLVPPPPVHGVNMSPSSGALTPLFFILVLLNIALGRATQRLATAPNATVDERQEARRNQAHHIAYVLFVVIVACTLVVADVVGPETRAWLAAEVRYGGFLVLLELLFVLPAMVMAVLEPDHLRPDHEVAGRASAHSGGPVALLLLALSMGTPLVLSALLVALPSPVTTTMKVDTVVATSAGATSVPLGCKTLTADALVGRGIEADIRVNANVCWNGRAATESYGLDDSDCYSTLIVAAYVTTQECRRTATPDGTLHFIWRAAVAPALLPFLQHDVTVQVTIDRNGVVHFS